MARCEDYPCCGHTDGLPCDWKPPTKKDLHAFCEHEYNLCSAYGYQGDDDDDDEDMMDLVDMESDYIREDK